MKLISLIGARPQIIKEAILNQEFEREGIEEILVHSGQHYDFNMSDVFFKVLNIKKADYNLGIGSGTHAEMTGKTMIEFEKVVLKEHPDIILVYGDTNTTLAGALVGSKLKIPVAHVEAGIRQEPKDMPEEINRVLTDHEFIFYCRDVLYARLQFLKIGSRAIALLLTFLQCSQHSLPSFYYKKDNITHNKEPSTLLPR